MKDNDTGIRRLINGGLEIAGGAVGGALGFLPGEPAGAALLEAGSTAAVMALKRIGQEASERLLGQREKVRIGGVLAIAARETRQRLENGEKVRTDGFFEQKQTGRSDAEEVAESILLKSQREPEGKKIPYMGHLLCPPFAKQLWDFYSRLAAAKLSFYLFRVLRTFEDQDELYAQGRTKSGRIVTNARRGDSLHNYGLAADYVLDGQPEKPGIQWSWEIKSDFNADGRSDLDEYGRDRRKLGAAMRRPLEAVPGLATCAEYLWIHTCGNQGDLTCRLRHRGHLG
jgi:hypothetical protein